ncbi:MAG: phosphoribosylformylglycinamidine cyclo-ligase [Dethiobacteria bacterium]|jgi:phosphoribosylformylglycinamidine cyclo-ligase
MSKEIDYRQAGVDIAAGEDAVERIKGLARSTFRPGVLSGPGAFAGFFAPDLKGYRRPVLISGCDGVGTKLKLAFAVGEHGTIGEDCVAMCVNDILVHGAEPLFFLDYLAVGRLDPRQVEQIVAGIARGCRRAGCALLGGETAEMPGFYPSGEYELAGFAVGLVEQDRIIEGKEIVPGDVIVGLLSEGLHSNGFALARKALLERGGFSLSDRPAELGEVSLGEELLRPTRIYVPTVLPLLERFPIKGMAHITGGGLLGNLPRILPEGLQAVIDGSAWEIPPIFKLIEEAGPVKRAEMYSVFNMGIGYVLVLAPEEAPEVVALLNKSASPAFPVGRVTALEQGQKRVRIE